MASSSPLINEKPSEGQTTTALSSPQLDSKQHSPYEYTCLFSPCTRDVCVIHGRPSSAELSAKVPHRVGGYYPENPQKLCELDNCGIHIPPRTVFSVHPNGINRIRPDERIAYLPLENKLGMKKPGVTEKRNTTDLSTSPVSSMSMYSEQLPLAEIYDDKFMKPAKWYILSVVEKIEDLPIPRNRDFVSKIFATEDEREQAFEAYHKETITLYDETPPLMLTYGIQYAPEPGNHPAATSRKVFITGLDSAMPMYEVMARVRGGKILNVTTATSPKPIGHTVIVEFVKAEDAKAYVNFMADKTPDVFSDGVEVTLFKSHSYPISVETENDLRQKFTRQVVYLDFTGHSPKDFLRDFEARFRKPEDVLEDFWLDEAGTLWILFKSIEHASRFYKQTTRELERENPGAFDDDLYRFAPDPCDKPLDEGQELVQLARGPHRSLLDVWIKGEWDCGEEEYEDEEEEVEVGRSAPPEEDDPAGISPPSPPSPPSSPGPSGSAGPPSMPLPSSAPEQPFEIPGLGTGMWSRPWFLETLRRMNEDDYTEHSEFRRHRGQSEFMYRRHRRDPSFSRSWYPYEPLDAPRDNQPGPLELFFQEHQRLTRESGIDPYAPSDPIPIDLFRNRQRIPVPVESGYEDENKSEDMSAEAIGETEVNTTQSHREVPGTEVNESRHQDSTIAAGSLSMGDYDDPLHSMGDDTPVARSMPSQNDPTFIESLNHDLGGLLGDLVLEVVAQTTLGRQRLRSYSDEGPLTINYFDVPFHVPAVRARGPGEGQDLEAASEAECNGHENKEREDKDEEDAGHGPGKCGRHWSI
ncbi:hypothetical protein F4805DRAFT_475705 [Annulohypoxylon moriforme]|nr:hypothetical protein F4805DRAFT_475705 [Annulohypoxylon moriforme]